MYEKCMKTHFDI